MSEIKVAENLYHVGDSEMHIGLDCNPYLLIEEDEAVLFDPGSVIDYETVYANVCRLIDPSKIKYIVLHHQDPDFCSAVPLLEKKGIKAKVVTAWRTMTLIQYYKIQSEYYLVEEHNYQLILKSGRILKFLSTPYMHFPGAFATYDEVTKSLLSSDVFGAFSYNRTLYADDTYLQKMLTFHEHYMPSNDIVRPVMDMLLEYEIDRILPQHGSIIEGTAMVKRHILALRELECGMLLHVIKQNLMASGGYKMLFNEVYRRYKAVFSSEEVETLFKDMGKFTFNEAGDIVDYSDRGEILWEKIFETVHEVKGARWITVLDPYVKRLCSIYNLTIPTVINTLIDTVQDENSKLKAQNEKLSETIQEVQNRLIKCSVTGLYNEVFLDSLMMRELEKEDWRDIGFLAVMSLDQLVEIKFEYGDVEYKNTLVAFAYHLKEYFGEGSVFRLQSSDFAVYTKIARREEIVELMDDFRTTIELSQAFIKQLTISVGIVFSDEIAIDAVTFEGALSVYKDTALSRLKYAMQNGKNLIWHKETSGVEVVREGKVLLVDSDMTNLNVLKTFLNDNDISVITAQDGNEAAYLAETELPILIISEIMLPKSDGFILREKLLAQSTTKGIDMIYLSYLKDEKTVRRAMALGVTQFIKKPYMLSEIVGIVKKKVKGLM